MSREEYLAEKLTTEIRRQTRYTMALLVALYGNNGMATQALREEYITECDEADKP